MKPKNESTCLAAEESTRKNTGSPNDPPLVNSVESEAIILLREIADTLAAIRELGGEQLTYLMKINRRMP